MLFVVTAHRGIDCKAIFSIQSPVLNDIVVNSDRGEIVVGKVMSTTAPMEYNSLLKNSLW